MSEQTIIQVRVDQELKEQAADVFSNIGIDIPTAVRMFFKAAVRSQGLPFSTSLNQFAASDDNSSNKSMNILGRSFSADEVNAFFDWAKKHAMYEELDNDENAVVVLPLEYDKYIPRDMYLQLISKVPSGSVTCWEHIYDFLGKIYNRQVQGGPNRPLPLINTEGEYIPYWRLVTKNGVLCDSIIIKKEFQREKLIEEGVPVVQRGSIENSFKVDNYKKYMFNFGTLKIVRR